MEYSADAVASARSLQTYTVRHFCIDAKTVDMISHAVHIWCVSCLKRFFLNLTQLSVGGYILGKSVPDVIPSTVKLAYSDLRLYLFT
jgi:hypothetical protein